MKKYIVRLVHDFDEKTRKELEQQGIRVTFSDGVLPDLVAIESEQLFEDLRANHLFRSVEKERIGSVNI